MPFVVAPQANCEDVQPRAKAVPGEQANVGVHRAHLSDFLGRQVDAKDLERKRRVRVRVEVDRGRLIGGGLRLFGSLGPLREVDRASLLGQAEDLPLVVGLSELQIELGDLDRRALPVERLTPEPSVLDVSKALAVIGQLRRPAEIQLEAGDVLPLPGARPQDDGLLRLVVVPEGEEQAVRIGQPRQLRQIRTRPLEHRLEGDHRLRGCGGGGRRAEARRGGESTRRQKKAKTLRENSCAHRGLLSSFRMLVLGAQCCVLAATRSPLRDLADPPSKTMPPRESSWASRFSDRKSSRRFQKSTTFGAWVRTCPSPS